MKKVFLIKILFLILSANIYAQRQCDIDAINNGSQFAMNECASIEYHKSDKILNDTYKQLLNIHKNNKVFIANLKTAQKIWIKFRDAEAKMILTYADMPGNHGTMNSMLWSGELQALTEQRIKTLKKYIKDGVLDQDSEL